jgi:hypothetical protein
MTTPEDRAADGRPLGKVEPTTRRPQSAAGAGAGGTVSGVYGGKRSGDRGRVLPHARGLLHDPATVTFPTVVLTVVSASGVSVRDPC